MKRRDFLKNIAGPAAVVPFFSNRLFAKALNPLQLHPKLLAMLAQQDDRVLVVVQMNGGNDGLNMVLPLDQYTNLAAARANILIPDTSALVLGSSQTGLHPAMTGLKTLYDQNKLTLVQSVSYASQSFSHFRGTDIWNSASDSSTVLTTGWVGRYLEYAFPGYPDAYPSVQMPDPLAIQIGSNLSSALMGYQISTGQTVPTSFSGSITQLLSYSNSIVPSGNAGTELQYLRNQQAQANQYASSITGSYAAGTNMATYAASSSSSIAQQLKIVARLIKGGLKTRIYYVSIGGFDTHNQQVDNADHTIGTHATILGSMSSAIAAFQADLALMGLEDRVIGLTYSEFGRRVISNASVGTDHGAAAPMFIFGKKVNPGIMGTNPIIPANANSNTQVPMQYSFHQIYTSILNEWFCVPSGDAQTILANSLAAAPVTSACTQTALPVTMTEFGVEPANLRDAHVYWTTIAEDNVEKFIIERSTDASEFVRVGEVAAKGHSHDTTRYEYLDKDLPIEKITTYYYRIKSQDLDGSMSISKIKSVVFNPDQFTLDVYPNPTKGDVWVRINSGVDRDLPCDITVVDTFGRSMYRLEGEYLQNQQAIKLSLNDIAAGVYLVQVKNGSHQETRRLVLQQ